MKVFVLRILGLVTLVAAIGTAVGILAGTDNSELSHAERLSFFQF